MSSKELLAHLQKMKIPAKGHSSTLVDAYVDRIRKQLEPELAARRAAAEAKAAEKAAREAAAEAAKAAQAAAAEQAVAEQAADDAAAAEVAAAGAAAAEVAEAAAEAVRAAARQAAEVAAAGAAAKADAAADAEAADAAAAAEAAQEAQRLAAEQAARKAEVERERAQREKERVEREAAEAEAAAAASQAAVPQSETIKKIPRFSGLLSQIEAERDRLEAEKRRQAEQKTATRDSAARGVAARGAGATPAADAEDGRKGRGRKGKAAAGAAGATAGAGVLGAVETGKGSGRKNRAAQPAIQTNDLSDEAVEIDRYRKMALAAEQLQREKVLADARAAVEAAADEGGGRRKKRKEKRAQEAKERAVEEAIEKGLDPELVLDDSVVQISTGTTVQEFADALGLPSKDIVKRLFLLGTPLTVTQTMGDDLVELIADDLERKVRIVSPEEEYAVQVSDNPADLRARPPVVTVMGHVDHGKTSLLDAIRETGVVQTEAGGITQHIGASVAFINDRQITFIDTPGHEAFTAMRARGAAVTDVVVLVVAADDGVMPQTIEAINHAKAAGVPIVVAVNKIDKPGATPDRVRQELSEHGIIPEEWGGQNMFVDVSAKQRTGIDDLLEMILLQADVLELKANPDALASGFVIEAKLDKGRGPVATVLVQRGTLRVGDAVVVGTTFGRVRALVDPKGANVEEALPADPVEILGLGAVPAAGDEFRVFAEERDARSLAEDRALRQRLAEQQKKSHVTLEDLFSRIEQDKLSELNLVVKADVQGSIEALQDALDKMDQSEVRINVIHSAVGGITETDVTLATASDAVIVGFNVRPSAKAKQAAEREKVEIKTYKVIYQAIEEINAARVGLLSPQIVEEETGMAEVRETFKVPKVGTVAGCMVETGEIGRDDKVRIVRDGTVVFEGALASLRRFKEDVRSVKAGYECGIGIENYQDVKVGDVLETYRVKEVARLS
jgi:translation initiation factor IF-2